MLQNEKVTSREIASDLDYLMQESPLGICQKQLSTYYGVPTKYVSDAVAKLYKINMIKVIKRPNGKQSNLFWVSDAWDSLKNKAGLTWHELVTCYAMYVGHNSEKLDWVSFEDILDGLDNSDNVYSKQEMQVIKSLIENNLILVSENSSGELVYKINDDNTDIIDTLSAMHENSDIIESLYQNTIIK